MPRVARYLAPAFSQMGMESSKVVKDFYYKEAVMKPGAYALVKRLKENGVKLIIATATDKEMAKAALIRNGIWQDFMGMLT